MADLLSTNVYGTLTSSGVTTMQSDANISGTLVVSGNTRLSNVNVTNTITISGNTNIFSDKRLTEWSHLENGNFFNIVSETSPTGVYAGNNGSSIYVVGSTSDNVTQYNLSTAWNVATATFVANAYINAEETTAVDLFFRTDGTRMYVLGDSGNDITYYTLATPWSLGGTITLGGTFSVSAQTTAPTGMFISDDGTKMLVTSSGSVFQYTIPTAWDLSTASYDNKSYAQTQDTAVQAVSMNPSGTRMLLLGQTNDYIFEYALSTANDVTTASYTGRKKGSLRRADTSEAETSPRGMFVAYQNNRMYLIGTATDQIIEYNLDKGMTIETNTLSVEGAGHFSDSLFVGGDIRVASSVDIDNAFRVTGAADFNGIFTHNSGTGNYGGSGSTATYRVGYGATTSGSIKTIEVGTNGLPGSNTIITIGALNANSNVQFYANTVNISGNLILAGIDVNASLGGGSGAQGVQGAVGVQGFQGFQGDIGIQGFQGIQGAIGVQGTIGIQGFQGIQGVTGIQGSQGIQGLIGIQGSQGIQGLAGGVGLRTIWVPSQTMLPRTTNGAGTTTTESTTNRVMIKSLDFDQTTQEFAQFSIRMPKSWNEGTITYEVAWTATTGTGAVVWSLKGVSLSEGDPIDTALGTAVNVTDTLTTANDIHISPVSGALTIGGTPLAGDITFFELARAPADGADTLTADARLIGITLFITTDAQDDT